VLVLLAVLLATLLSSACGEPTSLTGDGDAAGSSLASDSLTQRYSGTWVPADDPGSTDERSTIVFDVSDDSIVLIDRGETIFTVEGGQMSYRFGDWYDSIDGPDKVEVSMSLDASGRHGPDDGFHGLWKLVGLPDGWSEWPSGRSAEVSVVSGSVLDEAFGAGEGALGIYTTDQYLFDGDALIVNPTPVGVGSGTGEPEYFVRQGASPNGD